jgi:hypothetical protein
MFHDMFVGQLNQRARLRRLHTKIGSHSSHKDPLEKRGQDKMLRKVLIVVAMAASAGAFSPSTVAGSLRTTLRSAAVSRPSRACLARGLSMQARDSVTGEKFEETVRSCPQMGSDADLDSFDRRAHQRCDTLSLLERRATERPLYGFYLV